MNKKKELWLLISGFGIMFAVLSWLQESNILTNSLGWLKGFFALVSGFFLFVFFRKSL
jgi:Flp pilus assembly protein protease CpaA